MVSAIREPLNLACSTCLGGRQSRLHRSDGRCGLWRAGDLRRRRFLLGGVGSNRDPTPHAAAPPGESERRHRHGDQPGANFVDRDMRHPGWPGGLPAAPVHGLSSRDGPGTTAPAAPNRSGTAAAAQAHRPQRTGLTVRRQGSPNWPRLPATSFLVTRWLPVTRAAPARTASDRGH